jgi:hypothetical protein
MINPQGLLFIHPFDPPSEHPLIDELTKRMTAAFNRCERGVWLSDGGFRVGHSWRGSHRCSCGAISDSQDRRYNHGMDVITNSLCVHYLAYHRDEIPEIEIAKVRLLPARYEMPTEEQLKGFYLR